jgi:hypothetical protein
LQESSGHDAVTATLLPCLSFHNGIARPAPRELADCQSNYYGKHRRPQCDGKGWLHRHQKDDSDNDACHCEYRSPEHRVDDARFQFQGERRLLAQPELQYNLSCSAVQHLFLQLGRAYELTSDFAQANAVYEGMLAYARERGELEMESVALSHLAMVAAQSRFDVETAAKLLYQALQVAEQSGNMGLVAETEWSLAQQLNYRCDPAAALPHGEHALMLARQSGESELIAGSLNAISSLRSPERSLS